jgi:hypothetical protein
MSGLNKIPIKKIDSLNEIALDKAMKDLEKLFLSDDLYWQSQGIKFIYLYKRGSIKQLAAIELV